MRRRARIDANHNDVVKALQKAGARVQSLATIGGGCPDLLVSKAGRMWVLEVKDGQKPPSDRRLTEDEQRWHATWGAPVHVVESAEQALEVIR